MKELLIEWGREKSTFETYGRASYSVQRNRGDAGRPRHKEPEVSGWGARSQEDEGKRKEKGRTIKADQAKTARGQESPNKCPQPRRLTP